MKAYTKAYISCWLSKSAQIFFKNKTCESRPCFNRATCGEIKVGSFYYFALLFVPYLFLVLSNDSRNNFFLFIHLSVRLWLHHHLLEMSTTCTGCLHSWWRAPLLMQMQELKELSIKGTHVCTVRQVAKVIPPKKRDFS